MARELSELEHLLDAAETLREVQSRRPAIARFEVASAVKTNAQSTVFEGRYEGAAAMLKLFHGEDRTERARAQKRELLRLSAFMDKGHYRIASLIAAWPGEGITVTARIAGTNLDRAIAEAPPEDRAALVAGAGKWLAHLIAPATRESEFGGRYWVRARGAALAGIKGGEDGKLARALAQRLEALLPTVAGHPITQARSHGDFAPGNLILTGAALYGIDIQNAHWLPLAKDLARFLVFLQSTHPRPAARHRFGIAAPDYDALTDEIPALAAADRERHLPFFVGVELADKLATTDRSAPKADALRAAIARYLEPGGVPVL